jgi:hypothetical protein
MDGMVSCSHLIRPMLYQVSISDQYMIKVVPFRARLDRENLIRFNMDTKRTTKVDLIYDRGFSPQKQN